MNQDKIYCGNGKNHMFQNGGQSVTVSLDIGLLWQYFEQYGFTTQQGKKMIRIKVVSKSQMDQYGNTHYAEIDTWKPQQNQGYQQGNQSYWQPPQAPQQAAPQQGYGQPPQGPPQTPPQAPPQQAPPSYPQQGQGYPNTQGAPVNPGGPPVQGNGGGPPTGFEDDIPF